MPRGLTFGQRATLEYLATQSHVWRKTIVDRWGPSVVRTLLARGFIKLHEQSELPGVVKYFSITPAGREAIGLKGGEQ